MHEFNKNKFVFPLFLLIVSLAFYAIGHLAPLVKPASLDDLDDRYSIPAFPNPVIYK